MCFSRSYAKDKESLIHFEIWEVHHKLQHQIKKNTNIKAIPLFSEKVIASFTVFYRTITTTVFLIFVNPAETYTIHFETCSTTEVIS